MVSKELSRRCFSASRILPSPPPCPPRIFMRDIPEGAFFTWRYPSGTASAAVLVRIGASAVHVLGELTGCVISIDQGSSKGAEVVQLHLTEWPTFQRKD